MAKPNTTTGIAALARRLRTAMDTGKGCKPLRNDLPDGDLDAAYAVQETNTKHWLKAGRRPVGRKIGLTSKVVQTQLGVDQPVDLLGVHPTVVQAAEVVQLANGLGPHADQLALIFGHGAPAYGSAMVCQRKITNRLQNVMVDARKVFVYRSLHAKKEWPDSWRRCA